MRLGSKCVAFSASVVRRQWHPTPVLLPGESHGRRSLVGFSPWGREESDTTERLHFYFSLSCIGEGNGNPLQCSCLENLGTAEPGGLPSMKSDRVGHNWSDLAAAVRIEQWALISRLPWWLSDKEFACQAGDAGSIPGSGRSPGGRNGNPLQYSCLKNKNPMDRGAWCVTVHGVAKSLTRLSTHTILGIIVKSWK